jgi:hypothetical protein
MKENKYKRRTSTEFKQQTTKFQDEKGTGMGGGENRMDSVFSSSA